MHERYAYGALVFLLLLIPEARLRWLSVAFGVVFTLNLLAAVPPTPEIGAFLPIGGGSASRVRSRWSPAPHRPSSPELPPLGPCDGLTAPTLGSSWRRAWPRQSCSGWGPD